MDVTSNSPYSSGSDKPDSGSPSGVFGSDEEVKLASRNPKKKAGRKKFKETRHPVFRGIRMRNNDKWVCEVREPTKQARIWLGTYPTAEMAARAHDVAALAFRGKAACLNFADSAWRLPSPASLDANDIRKAAAEAADMFRPTTKSPEGSSRVEVEARDDQARVEESGGEVEASNDVGTSAGQDMSGFDWSENMFSADENMSELLHDMAGGLLISPPPLGDFTTPDDDDDGGDGDVPLWSYSM